MKPKYFLSVLGPSRSGTTVLTAIIDSHPNIEIAFEPFASQSRENNILEPYENIDRFLQDMNSKYACQYNSQEVVGMKNTTGPQGETDWVKSTLSSFSNQINTKIVIIIRDPVESYLSNVSANQKWWRKDLDLNHDIGLMSAIVKFENDLLFLK